MSHVFPSLNSCAVSEEKKVNLSWPLELIISMTKSSHILPPSLSGWPNRTQDRDRSTLARTVYLYWWPWISSRPPQERNGHLRFISTISIQKSNRGMSSEKAKSSPLTHTSFWLWWPPYKHPLVLSWIRRSLVLTEKLSRAKSNPGGGGACPSAS